MLNILWFFLKKIHYLTGKIPVSIDDYFRIFHTLTGKVPVKVKMIGWRFLLLTGNLPVSDLEKAR